MSFKSPLSTQPSITNTQYLKPRERWRVCTSVLIQTNFFSVTVTIVVNQPFCTIYSCYLRVSCNLLGSSVFLFEVILVKKLQHHILVYFGNFGLSVKSQIGFGINKSKCGYISKPEQVILGRSDLLVRVIYIMSTIIET